MHRSRCIAEMPAIQSVGLHGISGFTAAGWLSLSKVGHLRTLRLSRIHPGPDGYAHLAKSQSLESMDFNYTPPTEAELKVIGTMQHLQKFTVQNAKLSDDAIAFLKAALPNLVIQVGGTRQ